MHHHHLLCIPKVWFRFDTSKENWLTFSTCLLKTPQSMSFQGGKLYLKDSCISVKLLTTENVWIPLSWECSKLLLRRQGGGKIYTAGQWGYEGSLSKINCCAYLLFNCFFVSRSSHYSMGSRAFSHDSIFIPDGRAESEQAIQAMSQENTLGKVKTLQVRNWKWEKYLKCGGKWSPECVKSG